MDKSTLLLLAVVLAVFGVSVAAGHPHWGTFTGAAIILLAAGLAAGALPLHSRDYFDERIGASPRVSNSLITLSSAAIVAVYAAGYHRTNSAAHRFDSRGQQQKTGATIAAGTPQPAANPETDAAPPALRAGIPPVKRNNPRPPTLTRKPAPAKPAEPAGPRYKDGTYLGIGSCPHGDIEASVVIQDGKIVSALISQCLTRYSCAWIAPKIPGGGLPDLPSQVVERQSPKVDYVSGATESSYAFSDAVAGALSKALE
jgi:uncharacterized protein with FMN-binding domain